jgi:uncharacterized glyoxalase superfamily protein PhnB
MRNENIDDMLASVINNDKDEFSSTFSDEIRSRIASKMVDMNVEISKDLLSNDDTDVDDNIDESRKNSVVYNFKNTTDAKRFIKAALNAGVNKRNIKSSNTNVSISSVEVDIKQVLHYLAKDMKAVES